MPVDKVVIAYSGGLDTSVAIRWLRDNYNLEVVTLTIDLGANDRDLETIRDRAMSIGAVKAVVIDAKDIFVKHFVFPALQAGALYEGKYPLATALARPLIASLLVDVAREESAGAVAHGCTGKGNDQVRFDVATAALAPDLKVIAPIREWKMSREEEIEYAVRRNIPIPVTAANPYSIDQNLWGRAIECGALEDPWAEAPVDAFEWTRNIGDAPDEPTYLEIDFEQGIPTALNGERLGGVALVERLNDIAGRNGVGRIDLVENRLVGIKSREVYEAPAALTLHEAHQALEEVTLSKESARFKQIVAAQYADLVYNGQWFSSLHQDLAVYVASSQRHVTGSVRLRLHKGTCQAVGRRSPYSLYNRSLATYDRGDTFDSDAAEGFISIYGLPLRTQARVQMLRESAEALGLMPGRAEGQERAK
ncbi:MAG: argininosuccinate synthase [Chloroflexi bacterium]|nr:argininosuccinate synthase [Chloroflexota bacterium]